MVKSSFQYLFQILNIIKLSLSKKNAFTHIFIVLLNKCEVYFLLIILSSSINNNLSVLFYVVFYKDQFDIYHIHNDK